MINSVKDLLDSIMNQGKDEISKYLFIKHGPTIGAMFEGLTKELMEKAIFMNLDLKVCSGFITNDKKEQSKQIDCMIVNGDGQKMPFTNEYIYHINQVVAVIEVKKNLFGKELDLAYKNLLSVKDIMEPNQDMAIERLEQAYENVAGKKLPLPQEVNRLTETEQYLYHALVVESYLPARVTFGYDGFSTEKSFREAYYQYISKNINTKGYGYTSMPSILISGKNSIIKTNGLPFAISGSILKKGEWFSMGSSNGSPLYFLLYIIWTRLYYLFPNLPENIFDNTEIAINPLLKAKGCSHGWEYTYCDYALDESYEGEWKPIEISLMSNALLKMIQNGSKITTDNKDVIDFCSDNGEKFEEIVSDLEFKRIIYVENNLVRVLPEEWLTVIYNGTHYFGDNFNNRMLEWYENLLNQNQVSK